MNCVSRSYKRFYFKSLYVSLDAFLGVTVFFSSIVIDFKNLYTLSCKQQLNYLTV